MDDVKQTSNIHSTLQLVRRTRSDFRADIELNYVKSIVKSFARPGPRLMARRYLCSSFLLLLCGPFYVIASMLPVPNDVA